MRVEIFNDVHCFCLITFHLLINNKKDHSFVCCNNNFFWEVDMHLCTDCQAPIESYQTTIRRLPAKNTTLSTRTQAGTVLHISSGRVFLSLPKKATT